MATYGLTSSGFNPKRAADILDEKRTALQLKLGPDLDLDPDDVLGQIIGVESIQLADIWSLALAMYNALDRDSAEGTLLENLCSLTGTERQDATKGQIDVTVTGISGTVIPLGSIVRIQNGARFLSTAQTTIPVGGSTTMTVEAENAGELTIGANTVDQIVTAITGWNTVLGPAATVTAGTNLESDLELRIRARSSLQASGAGTEGAIRSYVLRAVEEVEACVVISNRTDATVGGRPPHSFETIIWPDTLSAPTEEEIVEAIYLTMPSGIQAFGSESYDVTDSRGYEQTVAFSYASQIAANVVMTVTTDSDFPDNGEDLIEAAVEAVFEAWSIGDDINYSQVYSAVYTACAGVDNIVLAINGGAVPIAIDDDEIAVLSAWGAGSSITIV